MVSPRRGAGLVIARFDQLIARLSLRAGERKIYFSYSILSTENRREMRCGARGLISDSGKHFQFVLKFETSPHRMQPNAFTTIISSSENNVLLEFVCPLIGSIMSDD